MADALRAARAPFVKWKAQDAGVEDLSKCGLKGSPTVIKRVFAPSARGDKAGAAFRAAGASFDRRDLQAPA